MARSTRLRIWSYFRPEDVSMLRTSASEIALNDVQQPEFQSCIDDMLVTMRQAEGIGLAAPQIGSSVRLAVIDRSVDQQLKDDIVMINPIITYTATEREVGEEGCLSIPKVFGNVSRSLHIRIGAIDRRGLPFHLEAHGLLARVIQHEIDHLHGVLFIDHAEAITKGKSLLS